MSLDTTDFGKEEPGDAFPRETAKSRISADPVGCEGADAERTQSSMRPHCQQRDDCQAKGSGAHCRRCANIVLNKTAGHRTSTADAMRRKWSDAEYRASHSERTRAGIAQSMQDPARRESRRQTGLIHGSKNIVHTRAPESRAKAGRAGSATKLAHIPPSLRDEYRKLVRQNPTMKAAEAARIVIQSAAEAGRREIAAVAAEMRAKAARQKREAY